MQGKRALFIAILTMASALVGVVNATLPADSQAAAKHGRSGKQLRVKLRRMRIFALHLRAQRNHAHRRISTLRSEREEARADRDGVASQRDKATSERDDALSERDDAISERNQARSERDEAVDAIEGGLPQQVTQVAKEGSIGSLHSLVLEPIRAHWPCGASLFQGEFFYSLDVELTTFDGDLNEIDCKP